MEYGVLSILPAMIVIIFALLTKKTLEALLLGTLSTYIIMYGFGFGSKWSEAFFTAAGNPEYPPSRRRCSRRFSLRYHPA